MADTAKLQAELADAAMRFSRGEISVEELTSLAARISAAADYVENNEAGPMGVLIEEFEGMDIDGYLISLYHDPKHNLSTVTVRFPGGPKEFTELSGVGMATGYEIFENAKATYRKILRKRQLEKYGDEDDIYGDD